MKLLQSVQLFFPVGQKDSAGGRSELWARPPDPLTFDLSHKSLWKRLQFEVELNLKPWF